MKHYIGLLCIGLSVFLSGCASSQTKLIKAFEKAGTEAFVSFERTACFGTCPVYTVKISGDLKITYKGREFSQPKGEYEATITSEEWKTLQEKIAMTRFFELEDEYDGYITDVPSAITTVHINEKRTKRVLNKWEAPEDLVRLETHIDQLWQKYFKEQ
ncbi:MAG: hypothetical protein JJU02_14105 [Cryomorphaceae bacterium]|nr:hypothetical protein [Cryomorphaceae bacterium]